MSSADQMPVADATVEREPRDARRRRELIEATITSISKHGLSQTTVAKVAEIAGLSAGIVNFYFRTKDALLLATLEHMDLEFERRKEEVLERAGDDPARQLEAMIDLYFDPELSEPGRVAVWLAFWGEAGARDAYQRVCGGRDEAEERHIVTLFEEITRRGNRDHLDPTALGLAYYHLVSSLPENMLDSAPFNFEDAKATCRSFLASIFPAEFSAPGAAPTIHAPADPASVEDAAAPSFETLPNWVYHDPEFYQLEKQQIFLRHWLLVGHASHAPEPGDYMTLEVAGERAFVIRGRDRVLRAFHNVCRHRASRVVADDIGNCSGAIVCPYHGWSYGFDGKLRAVREEKSFRGLDKTRLGLFELELEEWMGFVFVRFGGDGPSVEASMHPVEEEARHYRFADMKPWRRPTSVDCDFNWKLFVENDAEGYHIPTGHPGLRRLFGNSYADDTEFGETEGSRAFAVLQDKESTVWSERAYQRLLPAVDHLPEKYRRAWIYYAVFPTAVLQVTPDLVDCYQVLPVGPDRCRIHGFSVGLEDDRREMRAARYLNLRLNRQVFKEDVNFCRWTDEGVRSSAYPGGMLSDLESGVRDFQDRIRELIPVARCPEAPPAGRITAVNREMQRDD